MRFKKRYLVLAFASVTALAVGGTRSRTIATCPPADLEGDPQRPAGQRGGGNGGSGATATVTLDIQTHTNYAHPGDSSPGR